MRSSPRVTYRKAAGVPCGAQLEEPRPAWSPIAEAMPLAGIEVDLIELHVTEGLDVAGPPPAEVAVPIGSIVTAVVRRDAAIVPIGRTEIEVGGVLLITTQRDRDAFQRLASWARGEPALEQRTR